MPAAAPPPAKVEQSLTYLRVAVAVVALPVIVLADFPDDTRLVVAWCSQALLVVGTAMLWVWRRSSAETAVVLHAGLALDVMVIGGYVVAFAHVTPGVAWAMAFTVLADASMRYGANGAVVGWVLAMAVFVVHGEVRAATLDRSFGWQPVLYVGAALVVLAAVLAAFGHVVESQTRVVRDQARRLAAVQRLRDRLVAASSHEFKGSLSALSLGVETVRGNVDRLGPDRVRAILTDVLQQTAHLQRLVDDLQAVTEAHDDDIDLRATREDVAASVDVAVAAAARHRNGHELEVDVPHVVCEIDHVRLQQVVRNLVENGLKYTPEGGRVSVRVQHADGLLDLRVADSGPGIPRADHERIFEAYGRRAEDHADVEGLGLGLYLVRQIVEAMHGSIDLSTSAAGTEFVVRIPVDREAASRRPGFTAL